MGEVKTGWGCMSGALGYDLKLGGGGGRVKRRERRSCG